MVEYTDDRMARLETDVEAMNKKLDEILTCLSQTEAGTHTHRLVQNRIVSGSSGFSVSGPPPPRRPRNTIASRAP